MAISESKIKAPIKGLGFSLVLVLFLVFFLDQEAFQLFALLNQFFQR